MGVIWDNYKEKSGARGGRNSQGMGAGDNGIWYVCPRGKKQGDWIMATDRQTVGSQARREGKLE